jgi:hypothetical protein
MDFQDETFDLISYNIKDYEHIIDIRPTKFNKKSSSKSWWSFI